MSRDGDRLDRSPDLLGVGDVEPSGVTRSSGWRRVRASRRTPAWPRVAGPPRPAPVRCPIGSGDQNFAVGYVGHDVSLLPHRRHALGAVTPQAVRVKLRERLVCRCARRRTPQRRKGCDLQTAQWRSAIAGANAAPRAGRPSRGPGRPGTAAQPASARTAGGSGPGAARPGSAATRPASASNARCSAIPCRVIGKRGRQIRRGGRPARGERGENGAPVRVGQRPRRRPPRRIPTPRQTWR